MPEFTITISDAALARLQGVVQRYNEQAGTNLTVKQWAILHIKEIAIQQEFVAKVEAIEKQNEDRLQGDLLAERQRLIDSI